jgi:hypothetical protein
MSHCAPAPTFDPGFVARAGRYSTGFSAIAATGASFVNSQLLWWQSPKNVSFTNAQAGREPTGRQPVKVLFARLALV